MLVHGFGRGWLIGAAALAALAFAGSARADNNKQGDSALHDLNGVVNGGAPDSSAATDDNSGSVAPDDGQNGTATDQMAVPGDSQDTAAPDAAPDTSATGDDMAAPDSQDNAAPAGDQNAAAPDSSDASSGGASVSVPELPTLPAIPKLTFTVTIPTINAVGSSVDEATLRQVLSGQLADNAQAMATLTADSIAIPEIDIGIAGAAPGNGAEVMIHNIEIDHVANGLAQSLSIGGMESRADIGSASRGGRISAEQVDIGGLLAFYGLVKGDPSSPLKPIYTNLSSEGGTLTAPGTNCTIGRLTVASLKARPLKLPFLDFISLVEKLQTGAEPPSPQVIRPVLDFYQDLLTAIQSSPMQFSGFNCSAVAADATPVEVAVGGMTMGSFGGLRYPDFILRNVRINGGDKGSFSLGQFAFKGFDLSSFFAEADKLADAAGQSAPTSADYRALIPPFAGFALSDLNIDTPDQQNPGERVKARLADFDLDLGNYRNGLPTEVSSRMQHLVVSLPPTSSDPSLRSLMAVGLTSLDLSYDVAARWDEASKEIRISRFSLSGDHLGSIDASSVIGQAGADLFSGDTLTALSAALGLTVKKVNVEARDTGLGDLLAAAAAKGSDKGVADMRRSASAMVQATLVLFLGGAANGADVGGAVGKFINGGKSLSITALANDPAGVSLAAIQALQQDPTAVGTAVTIDAEAR